MDKLRENLTTIWGGMTPTRRWVVGGMLLVCLLGFAWVINSQTRTNWVPLGRGLSSDDLNGAVTALEARNIPVRMGEGDIVEVPQEKLHEARLVIAQSAGDGGTVGMELFNKPEMGRSKFENEVNYHRALEGELARTIRSLETIKAARVHLSIPKKRLFKKHQKTPSASVKLTLQGGVSLSKMQIAGISNLIVGAVEGMGHNKVSIIDQHGNVLARPQDSGGVVAEGFMDMQSTHERKLEAKVMEVLEPVVGEGKVRVQVTATMDFSTLDITEKSIDPDKQVVTSETRNEESSTSTDPVAGGVAGAAANVPGGVGVNKGDKSTSRTAKRESIQYQTESSVQHTTKPAGSIDRLTVAVVVDGKMAAGDDGAEAWTTLTAEELADLEMLAANAVGLVAKRGDTITVKSKQFQAVDMGEMPEEPAVLAPWMRDGMRWTVLLLLGLMLIFGVARPLLKAAQPQKMLTTGEPTLALAGAGGEVFGEAGDVVAGVLPPHEDELVTVPVGERLRLKAIDSAGTEPDRAVEIIRTWLLMED